MMFIVLGVLITTEVIKDQIVNSINDKLSMELGRLLSDFSSICHRLARNPNLRRMRRKLSPRTKKASVSEKYMRVYQSLRFLKK